MKDANNKEWEEELVDNFAVMFERAHREDGSVESGDYWVDKLVSFISSIENRAYELGKTDGEKNCTKWHVDFDNGISPENIIAKAEERTKREIREDIEKIQNEITICDCEDQKHVREMAWWSIANKHVTKHILKIPSLQDTNKETT